MPIKRHTTYKTVIRARELRHDQTVPEQLLWQHLRSRRLSGLKFVRQVPLESFVIDFLCREKKLAIELDGDSHADRGKYDANRQRILEAHGLTFLRIANDDVLRDIEKVLEGILRAAGIELPGTIRQMSPSESNVTHPHPNPLPPSGRGST